MFTTLDVFVNWTCVFGQIGDCGVIVNDALGCNSIFMVWLSSETVLHKSGFTASNFISQQPAIVINDTGIVKSFVEFIHVLLEETAVKLASPGFL